MTVEKRTEGENDNDPRLKIRDKIDEVGPTLAMCMIIALVILVVVFVLMPRDPDTIVIQSQNGAADFSATTALAYADRVSRIAELAVATVLTLAIGLVGFSWVSNNARIERDRQELRDHKDELERRVVDNLESIKTEIMDLRQEIANSAVETRVYVDDRLQGTNESKTTSAKVISDTAMLLDRADRMKYHANTSNPDVALVALFDFIDALASDINKMILLELSTRDILERTTYLFQEIGPTTLRLSFVEQFPSAIQNASEALLRDHTSRFLESADKIHDLPDLLRSYLTTPRERGLARFLSSIDSIGSSLTGRLQMIESATEAEISSIRPSDSEGRNGQHA